MIRSLTDHQAKYLANELTRRHPVGSSERLASVVASAQVDLNPHQVDAALFAIKSPLSRGVLLADEVGLGKTIEAGLVLSQRWAERKRRLLVITPSNLRKQWLQELSEKFFLPCSILESRSYNATEKAGGLPFHGDRIVICSYEFARSKAVAVQRENWDLVVFDEAHRLRNVWKPSNVTARALKSALSAAPKILLTATPLQNSLQELYGLISFIDEHTFGDLGSFKQQFMTVQPEHVFQALQQRLRPLCHRTLRRQVSAYVKYSRRIPLVQDFTPAESEKRLYEVVTEYLTRPNLAALPMSQRTLITLVLQRQLASSTFAIAGSLDKMARRLRDQLAMMPPNGSVEDDLAADVDGLDSIADEWGDQPAVESPASERAAIEREIADLQSFVALATSIVQNSKGTALLQALRTSFGEAARMGAAEKAIIFTESRRTQDYLVRLLSDSPFADGIVLFNGSNTDARSREIYQAWAARHAGSDRVTGSRTADMRSALVDYFREEGRIMIATEAGAEGINLQFCSLVVNYDLPWNPQRIEQRIGRCHRYGQQHDVVVVNFLNRDNAADRRVFELLSDKFKLFDGVFGASDEVLGAIESGVDFEKRIAAIYRECRHADEIEAAFNQLQTELSLEIQSSLRQTREALMEHFDDEVREKLKLQDARSREELGRHELNLMAVTCHELRDHAEFVDDGAFVLRGTPFPERRGEIPLGLYELPRRTRDAHLYRANHPLAEAILRRAMDRPLDSATLVFDYAQYEGKVSDIEVLVGQSGWLAVSCYSVLSGDEPEEHLVLAGVTDSGVKLEPKVAERILMLPATAEALSTNPPDGLAELIAEREGGIDRLVDERNGAFLDAESTKLDAWADDLKLGLEVELKETDQQIREAKQTARIALTLEEKLAGQREVKKLEQVRRDKRRALYQEQDRIDGERDALIERTEAQLVRKAVSQSLFTVRWTVS